MLERNIFGGEHAARGDRVRDDRDIGHARKRDRNIERLLLVRDLHARSTGMEHGARRFDDDALGLRVRERGRHVDLRDAEIGGQQRCELLADRLGDVGMRRRAQHEYEGERLH